jgi:hypothetical protein
MSKKPEKKSVHVSFRVTLELGMDMGASTLEEALTKARAMKPTDLLDLSDLEYNDGSIEVSGLFN